MNSHIRSDSGTDPGLVGRVLDAISDPVFVKDRQGRLVLVNDAYCRFAGHPRESLLGTTAYDFFPRQEADIYAEKDEIAFRTGEANVNEEPFTDATGVRHWIQTKKAPLEGADGAVYLVAIIRDITAERGAQERLKESEALLQEAQRLAGVGSWTWRHREDVALWSRETYRILGCDPALPAPSSARFPALFTPETWERLSAAIGALLREGRPYELEGELAPRDGVRRWVISRGEPLRDDKGEIAGVHGTVQDVTARRELERLRAETEAMRRTMELRSQFLAAMSHELKTPLNAILGFSDLLRDETAEGGAARGLAEDIHAAGRRLLALLTDVLELARLEEGGETLAREPVDLALGEAAAGQRAPAARRGIALDVKAQGAGTVQADARKLRQLLAQLLSNALKFTPQGGRVTLSAARSADGGWHEVAVADTGIGIAAADREKLFRPFVQLDAALSRKYGGTGLGLALVKRIAELHGGEVSVESEPGRGSVFKVRLPA